jgi:nitrate reductase gamma subunit
VKRRVIASAVLGLVASALAYAMLLTTDLFHVRLIGFLIWPTVLFLLANESPTTTSLEMATNFAKAIGGNVALYVAIGVLVFWVRSGVRKAAARRAHEV